MDQSSLFSVLKKERNLNLCYGGMFILAGLSTAFFLGAVNLPLMILLILLMIVLILVGFKFLLEAFQNWDVINHRLFQLLERNPKKIVWVYSIHTELAPFGISVFNSGELFFKLDDGNQIIVNSAPSKLKTVSQELNAFLPHATFGYSEERDQWYSASPFLLLKN